TSLGSRSGRSTVAARQNTGDAVLRNPPKADVQQGPDDCADHPVEEAVGLDRETPIVLAGFRAPFGSADGAYAVRGSGSCAAERRKIVFAEQSLRAAVHPGEIYAPWDTNAP